MSVVGAGALWAMAALVGGFLARSLVSGRMSLRQGGALTRRKRPAMYWFVVAIIGLGCAALVIVAVAKMDG